MLHAPPHPTPTPAPRLPSPAPMHEAGGMESVPALLARGHALPCGAAARAFEGMVPRAERFKVALEVLLPVLEDGGEEPPSRILVSYLLHALYTPHPIALNPFKTALRAAFLSDRAAPSRAQCAWALWKILRGEGQDLDKYTPAQLVAAPLPPSLRPAQLTLDESVLADIPPPAPPAPAPAPTSDSAPAPVSPADDARSAALAHAMELMLASRERVLRLSEMRAIQAHLPALTHPPVLTSHDLPRVAARNPALAHPLLADAVARGGARAHACLEAVAGMDAGGPAFDLLGRLLRDARVVEGDVEEREGREGGRVTVGEVVRREVLGPFVSAAVRALEGAEDGEAREQGIQNLCRFYHSLIRLGIVDAGADVESAEMGAFALRHARLEEANGLYGALAAAHF